MTQLAFCNPVQYWESYSEHATKWCKNYDGMFNHNDTIPEYDEQMELLSQYHVLHKFTFRCATKTFIYNTATFNLSVCWYVHNSDAVTVYNAPLTPL